jgi:hypothetical protein
VSDEALDLMWALRLEDGSLWGEKAADFQKADAEAIFADHGPRLHFITRPRGGSKTTDIAAVALAWLVMEAPPLANAHVVAANAEQATILIDAAAAFIVRTPELHGLVTVEAERLIGPNGAWVRVLPQSSTGAWGLRDAHLLICDEFAQWENTTRARRVWTAIRSTVQKVPGCRLILLTSAGEPSHWTYPIYERAKKDPMWRVSEAPGPVPWQSPADLEALRRELLPSEYDRLVLNLWTEGEDHAITPEDWAVAAVPCHHVVRAPAGIAGGGWRVAHHDPLQSYIITIDLGLKADATVIVVAHKEWTGTPGESNTVMIVDHLERYVGSRKKHVPVAWVEERLMALAREYHARILADPYQMAGSIQKLRAAGFKIEEFPFTATSVSEIAHALVKAFHNRRITVPDIRDLETELLTVRLKETANGGIRFDHDADKHDDQAVALGIAAATLVGGRSLPLGEAWMIALRQDLAETPAEYERASLLRNWNRIDPQGLLAVTALPSSECRQPRYFAGQCVHCGLTPDQHLPKEEVDATL